MLKEQTMIPIDKMFIEMTVTDYKIQEGKLFGILNGYVIQIINKILSFPFRGEDNFDYKGYENSQEKLDDEDESQEAIRLYANHLTEARAEAMCQILIDFEHEYIGVMDSCGLSINDDYTYYPRLSFASEDAYRTLAIHFLNREKLENSMKTLDAKAFLKAKKMFWEKIIDLQDSQN